jgi:hypothetical protein
MRRAKHDHSLKVTMKQPQASLAGALAKMKRFPTAVAMTVAIIAVTIACWRVIATYDELSHTQDEPAHLSTGLQWWQDGEYTIETLHPPLARVAIAFLPYLKGARIPDDGDLWERGLTALWEDGNYQSVLTAMRLGNLPFFMLALLAAFLWGCVVGGMWTGVTALCIASLLPPLLAHAGLATTDMAVTALLPLALLAFWRWTNNVRSFSALFLLALTLALAVLAKFTTFLYFPVGALVILAWRWCSKEKTLPRLAEVASSAALLALGTFLIIWSGYRFSVGTAMSTSPESMARAVDIVFRWSGPRHDAGTWAANLTVPAPELPAGIIMSMKKSREGHRSYFMGSNGRYGWVGFFPTAVTVKTPAPIILLLVAGIAGIATRRRFRAAGLPLALAAAIVLVVMPSTINIGVRHVMPAFIFLAVVAATGVRYFLGRGWLGVVAAAILLSWAALTSARAHPDYLPWFNFPAADREPPVLLDSDYDWGQDLSRLSRRLDELAIEKINLCWPWTTRLEQHISADVVRMEPYEIPSGWTAVSITCIYQGDRREPFDKYAWVNGIENYELVGKTIRLFRLP